MRLSILSNFIAVILISCPALAYTQHAGHDPEQTAPDSVSTDVMLHDQHGDHIPVNSTDDSQQRGTMEHDEHMNHDQMEMSQSTQDSLLNSVRDPHAYSGGYELSTGPYTLESESQISLADTMNFTGLWVDRLEYVESHDADATEFEGHAWIGDSYNRMLLRAEVDLVNDSLETAELDLLHSRAISPFWDIRFGLRRELGEHAGRNWASIALNGLAPYWFEVDASLFIGEKGNTLLDLEAEYDLLLSQRLVFQPRIDIHAYGKTDAEMGHGKGLSLFKTGFRLRYEFDRQFTPYFGVERVLKYGETADLLPVGQDREDTHWLIGFRFWF